MNIAHHAGMLVFHERAAATVDTLVGADLSVPVGIACATATTAAATTTAATTAAAALAAGEAAGRELGAGA